MVGTDEYRELLARLDNLASDVSIVRETLARLNESLVVAHKRVGDLEDVPGRLTAIETTCAIYRAKTAATSTGRYALIAQVIATVGAIAAAVVALLA